MRKPLSPEISNAQSFRTHGISWTILSASLVIGLPLLWPEQASAQTSFSPNTQSSFNAGAASQLNLGSGRGSGIPLGSTEITTRGIAPIVPSPNIGMGGCAVSGNAGSSGALFDGGGLSGSTPLSCADSRQPRAPASSPLSVGRAGIPLGATELGNAGISPLLPIPGPNQPGGTIVAPLGSPQPATNAILPGAGP
jgi:hypothetical protein